MSDQVMQSETIGKLAEALAKAQGAIKGATKDTKNDFFRSKYADLSSVWDACRSQLAANGLSVIQTMDDSQGVTVVTTLAHSSGEWIRGRLTMKPVKDDPQGVGSAITYARRYALAAMVGVAPEDDDGNAASGRPANADTKVEPKKEHGQLHGPLKITDLKNGMKEFARDLEACSDADELNALMTKAQPVLEQCKRDLPDWYFGKEGTDVKGAQDRILARTEELNKKAA